MRDDLTMLSSTTLSATTLSTTGKGEGEGGSMTVEEGVCLGVDGLDGVDTAGRVHALSYSVLDGPSTPLFFLESMVPDPFEFEVPLVSILLPPAPPAGDVPLISPLSSVFAALTGMGSLLVSRDAISEGTGEAIGLGAGLDTTTAGATSCSVFQSVTGTGIGRGDTVRVGRGRADMLSKDAVRGAEEEEEKDP